jgi:hypothetical protein
MRSSLELMFPLILQPLWLPSIWHSVGLAQSPSFAQTVDVKYRGPVDLDKFQCTGELDSTVVKRVRYNAEHAYMLIRVLKSDDWTPRTVEKVLWTYGR